MDKMLNYKFEILQAKKDFKPKQTLCLKVYNIKYKYFFILDSDGIILVYDVTD